MDGFHIMVAMAVIVAVVVVSIFLLPYVFIKLTQPSWALGKSMIEGLLWMILLFIILSLFPIAPLLSVPMGVAIAISGYRSRVARYAAIRQNSSLSTAESVRVTDDYESGL